MSTRGTFDVVKGAMDFCFWCFALVSTKKILLDVLFCFFLPPTKLLAADWPHTARPSFWVNYNTSPT